MDDLAALRLQFDWGADEALLDTPVDRFATLVPAARSVPNPSVAAPAPTPASPAPASPAPAGPTVAVPTLAASAAADTHDLAALHAAMDAFDACRLRHTASTTVAPSGNAAAGLILVGEAPGPDDDRVGLAFSGAMGERMDRILASAGLGRADLLLTLMVPWRPPGGRPVSEAELALCLPFFHRLLALARPRHLVLMGTGPYRALARDDTPFRRARGKWSTVAPPGLEPLPALTMLAPDAWLASAANKQATWSDLLTLRDALGS